MDKADFQKVCEEAVKMAERASADPVMRAEVAKAIISLALRPYEHALRHELLHGKDPELK